MFKPFFSPARTPEAIRPEDIDGQVRQLLDFHRVTFGNAVMEDDGGNDPDPNDADGGDGDGGDGGDGDGGDGSDDDDDDPEGADKLGDAGKRALDTMKAKMKAEKQKRIAAERERDALKAPKDGEQTPEQIRQAAEDAATKKANERIVRAEVRGAAKALFHDPEDALMNLDLSQIDVGDDGDVDDDDIADALKDLLRRKPHLGKTAGQPGKQRVPSVPADPAGSKRTKLTLDQRIAAAQKAGDVGLIIQLQNQKLAEAEQKES